MGDIFAFVRRDALIAISYRTRTLLSLGSLLTVVVPLFFIAGALQPVVGDAISDEGGQYFAFLVIGMATIQFVTTSVGAIPAAVSSGIRTGTFEMLLTTPVRLHRLLAGMMAYPFLWTVARALLLLTGAMLLGSRFELHRVGLALFIWLAICVAYVPVGILGAALLVLTRTTGPLPNAVLVVSMFLGGVYYPTSVIPSWLQQVSHAVPLTYGLRALRRVLTEDVLPASVGADLAVLISMGVVMSIGSLLVFRFALGWARRSGTLAHY